MATPLAPARMGEVVADAVFEALLAVGFLFAMDALEHLKLTPAGFGLAAGGWIVTVLAARVGRWTGLARDWLPVTLELVLPALWLATVNGRMKQPWTAGEVVYAAVVVAALWQGWRWLLRRTAGRGCDRRAEAIRLFLVGLAAGGAVLPFFTDRQLGGADARWYTGVFIDFVSQLRAGFFPVFVGQTEFSFNGSVNLFRSAPLCLWLGGVCDLLTAQSLAPLVIRNLAVIAAALGAGFGMYVALLRLARAVLPGGAEDGGIRWIAALIAVLYVLCPSVLHALYYYELQMTFTALLALPWVFYGNLRTLHGTDGRGYLPLAVGLVLAWLAHAPLAIISMLVTAALQFGRFIFEPAALVQWKAAAGGALLFGLLGAYYFLGMSELPSAFGPGLRMEAVFMAGIILVVFGVVRLFYQRHWSGSLIWLAGTGLVGLTIPVWLVWVVVWSFLFGVIVLVCRLAGVAGEGGRVVWWAVAAMLGAAALAGWWAGSRDLPHDLEPMKALARNVSVRAELFQPVPAAMSPYGSSQPGLALWLLAAVALAGAWVVRSLALSLLAGVMIFIGTLVLGVPLVSDFVMAFAPPQIANLVTLPMLYRLVPPLAAMIGMGGFLTLGLLARRQPRWRSWGAVGLVVGVAWSSWEAHKFVRYGRSHLASREATAVAFAPHNYALGRYSYIMLVTPTAFIDGKQFPWLESRLLNPLGDLVIGPEQVARQAEEFDSETYELTSRSEGSDDPSWLQIGGEWAVQPGETRLLRLEISPGVNCSGVLMLRSEHGYQEFILTMNYPGTGFGIAPSASRVLSVTNPGINLEHYRLRLKAEAGNTMPRDGRVWGKLHVSLYKPERSPIKVESLLPYRARVEAPQAGFLEIPRQWLAGYAARVDGQPVAAAESPGAFVKVPVHAGAQVVELRYVGTPRLWAGLAVSATTLVALLGWCFAGGWDGSRRKLADKLQPWIEANKN